MSLVPLLRVLVFMPLCQITISPFDPCHRFESAPNDGDAIKIDAAINKTALRIYPSFKSRFTHCRVRPSNPVAASDAPLRCAPQFHLRLYRSDQKRSLRSVATSRGRLPATLAVGSG